MRVPLQIVLALGTLASTGCGTIFGYAGLQPVEVTSNPAGGEVFVNDLSTGQVTPCTVHLDPALDHAVMVRKDGLKGGPVQIEKTLRTAVLQGDLWLTLGIGAIVDYSTGGIHRLQASTHLNLGSTSALLAQADAKRAAEAEDRELARRDREREQFGRDSDRRRSRDPEPTFREPTESIPVPEDGAFGSYYALVIGINDYEVLPKLKTAVRDAQAVADVLRNDYGFTVQLLTDVGRGKIVRAFSKLRRLLKKSDNLLVYYAGHGWLDPDSNEGYWLPVDASRDDEVEWVSNATLSTALKAIQANSVMVVADSCYSGSLTRGLSIQIRTPDYFRKMHAKRARVVMTSGGMEPVEDGGGGKHSIFAKYFLGALRDNTGILDGGGLFSKIKRPIMLNSPQEPHFGDIRLTGHDGGDFLFVKATKSD
jgi:hypothetical protein